MADKLEQVESMADLEDDDEGTGGEEGGSGKKEATKTAIKEPEKTEDLTEAQRKQAEADKLAEDEKKRKEDEEKKGDDKEDEDKDDKEGKDKDDEDKKDDDKKEKEEIGFFEAVDRLTGRELKVDYGDVDPETPEGAVIREKAVEAAAVQQYEQTLKATFPRAFDLMLHIQSGKPEKDFWDKPTVELPALELFKDSVDLQKQVLLQEYIATGLSEAKAKKLVEVAVEEKTLTEEATAAYNKRNAQVESERAAAEKKIQEDSLKFQNDAKELGVQLGKVVKEDLKTIVPEAKQAEFLKFISNNLEYDSDGFMVTMPIKSDNMKDLVKGLYIMFTKANLQDAINMGVKQTIVRNLKKNKEGGRQTPAGGEAHEKDFVPLSEIWGDEQEQN